MMKKILVTGFEPFLDYKVNPTLEVMKALDGKQYGDYQVYGRPLVVDFTQSEKQLAAYLDEVQPDIIMPLGIAAGRFRITPEQIAINMKSGAKDNSGYQPIDEKIDEEGKDGIFTNLPIRSIVNKLNEEGFPAEISYTAGTYLCNNIMYRSMQYAEAHPGVLAGFIHIPASFELSVAHSKLPGWPIESLIRAVDLCIEETVNRLMD